MSELLRLSRSRTGLIWLALMAATFGASILGAEHGISGRQASVVVITVAVVKVRLVGLYFMELREAPTPLRLPLEGYCAVLAATLLVMYLAL